MQIVDVYNTDPSATLTLTNNGDRYDIAPGGHKIVPYDCAASAFGDPRARDTGRDRGRSDLYDHVRGMWNFNLGFDTAETWEEKRPKFTAWDVNSGAQIWFVIDDPKGEKVAVEVGDGTSRASTPSDTALISEQLAAMQSQIAALTTALALAQNQTAPSAPIPSSATTAPEVVPADDSVKSEPVATATLELPTAPDGAAKVTADGPKSVAPPAKTQK